MMMLAVVVGRLEECKEFLLEFYVSKYPEQFDKQQHFFLSNVKNILSNPTKYNTIVDIDKKKETQCRVQLLYLLKNVFCEVADVLGISKPDQM